jgi:hypothetical protein
MMRHRPQRGVAKNDVGRHAPLVRQLLPQLAQPFEQNLVAGDFPSRRVATRFAFGPSIGFVSITFCRMRRMFMPCSVTSRVANSPSATATCPSRINSRPTADHWDRVNSRPMP